LLTVRRQQDGLTVASQVEIAESLSLRLLGLIGRDRLAEGHGLFLRSCSSVHMFFMSFPIDVVYLDKDLSVVAVDTNLKPWRFGGLHWRAKHVLELRCYTAGLLKKGDKLEIIEEGA
jgi:uncharacterized membrane protein (UPF0127 family)